MKKILFLISVILINLAYTQVSIQDNRLLKDGNSYKFGKYKEVFSNPMAADSFAKARTNATFANAFSFTGGFLIGFGLIPAITHKKPENKNGIVYENSPNNGLTIMGIGAAMVGIAIPFYIGVKKNSDKALKLENEENSTSFKSHFKINLGTNAVALSYHF